VPIGHFIGAAAKGNRCHEATAEKRKKKSFHLRLNEGTGSKESPRCVARFRDDAASLGAVRDIQ
jgi:hypothetical protein